MSVPRVDIVYFDAGSGHRSAALGLARILRDRHGVEARAVDILDVIAGHPIFHRTVRSGIGYFNWWLRREGVWDLKGLINLSLLCHDLVSARGIRRIAEYWKDDPPAALVSVTPMYNGVLARAFHDIAPGRPYVVVPVDFEEGKSRYWFDSRVDAHYLLTGDRQREQALAAGVPEDRLTQLGGMVIDPAFYGDPPPDPAARLEELGLDPARPTVLISFGGQGSVLVERCARALAGVSTPLNIIALCGRDARLLERVRGLESPHYLLALGFAPEPPVFYHHLADVVIGKPGSMTIVESIVTGTPVLPIKSRGMWVVQRGNEEWVERKRVGHVVPTPEELPRHVEEVLADPGHAERARAQRHDAVFEAAAWIADSATPSNNLDPVR